MSTSRPRGPLAILDGAFERLRADPLGAYAYSLPTTLALSAIGLVALEATGGEVPSWVAARRHEILLALAAAFALVLPVRRVLQHLAVRRAYGLVGPVRWPPVLATGALVGFGLALAAAFFVVPALFLAALWFLSLPASVFEGLHTERALRRGWQLSLSVQAPVALAGGAALLLLLLAANVHLALPWLLWLAEAAGGADLVATRELLRLTSPRYLAALAALVFVLADPLLPLLAAELYRDVLVRQEGADLAAALDRLAAENLPPEPSP